LSRGGRRDAVKREPPLLLLCPEKEEGKQEESHFVEVKYGILLRAQYILVPLSIYNFLLQSKENDLYHDGGYVLWRM